MIVQLLAPAKVNLGLAVLGRRPDGYHEIESLMAVLDVGDTLRIARAPEGVTLKVRDADLPTGPENLVHRAATAYLAAAGEPGGVRIVLKKRLPIAAGLGGGSSDAAATLRGLAQLYPADVDLTAIARKLGADVPFLLQTPVGGAAIARGIGDELEPVRLPEVHLLLANPGVAVSAAEAYGGLNGRFGPPLDIPAILGALERGEEPPYRNDLELPVLERYPGVAQARVTLEAAGLRGVLMSGSGSTVFGLAESQEAALEASERLALERPGWWARAARADTSLR